MLSPFSSSFLFSIYGAIRHSIRIPLLHFYFFHFRYFSIFHFHFHYHFTPCNFIFWFFWFSFSGSLLTYLYPDHNGTRQVFAVDLPSTKGSTGGSGINYTADPAEFGSLGKFSIPNYSTSISYSSICLLVLILVWFLIFLIFKSP